MKLPTVIVAHPSTFTKSTKEQIIDLIVQGGQIKYNDAKVGIHRAFLLAICSVDENVIATACLKIHGYRITKRFQNWPMFPFYQKGILMSWVT